MALSCAVFILGLSSPDTAQTSELGLSTSSRAELTKRVRQGDFDAEAQIACAQEMGEALGVCALGVVRGADGQAIAVARFPNGFARQLTFVQGAFIRADTTMSGNGTDTEWHIKDGLYHIRVDDQRYEIPAALLFNNGT